MSALTIPMPDIITKLAAKVNCGDQTASAFLKEFSVVVTQGLSTDGVVMIDGLGTFKVTADMDGKPTVDFAPETSLAKAVNEPFVMFESVEVADSLTDEELEARKNPEDGKQDVIERDVTEAPEPAIAPEPEDKETPSRQETPPPVPPRFSTVKPAVNGSEHIHVPDREPVNSPATPYEPDRQPNIPTVYDSPVPVRLEPESRVTIKRVGHTTLTLIVTAIAACLFGLVIGYLAYRYVNFGLPGNVEILEEGILIRHDSRLSNNTETAETPQSDIHDDTLDVAVMDKAVSSPDTTTAAAASVSREEIHDTGHTTTVVTDTVKPGNYLSVMARRHYGNAKFWVYIYIENKDKIRDPDNLEDGMVLVIPPAGQYDIDPSSKESLRKAEREAYKAMSE